MKALNEFRSWLTRKVTGVDDRKIKYFRFEPKPDITAYEIAVLLKNTKLKFVCTYDSEIVPEPSRHFQEQKGGERVS